MFDLVPRCQVSRCPPLLSGAALSSLAMSALTILMVSRCPVPRFQSPRCEVGSGQKATGTKGHRTKSHSYTHLRVYCPAHKCNINTSLPGPYHRTKGHSSINIKLLTLWLRSLSKSDKSTSIWLCQTGSIQSGGKERASHKSFAVGVIIIVLLVCAERRRPRRRECNVYIYMPNYFIGVSSVKQFLSHLLTVFVYVVNLYIFPFFQEWRRLSACERAWWLRKTVVILRQQIRNRHVSCYCYPMWLGNATDAVSSSAAHVSAWDVERLRRDDFQFSVSLLIFHSWVLINEKWPLSMQY